MISMNKYPHLSNVLNREFDDVAKNEEEEIVGLKQVVEKLQELITVQTQAAKAKELRIKAEEDKVRQKETAEKEREEGGGKTKEESQKDDEEYKRISQAARKDVKRMGGKVPQTDEASIYDPPKETDKEKAKRKFKELPRKEQKTRRKKALENKINEENQRKTKEEAEAKQRQRQLELEQIQRRRQQKKDEIRRQKEELRSAKKNRENKYASEDNESNWFSAVRV